ncbi:MAG TPA: hypothetical protein VIW80_01615 [Pyrinomonadaceae bacterium]|jgi:hypothetical protein
MKPSIEEGFIPYTGALDESCLNYLTHNPSVSESSKSHAGYSDHSLFTSDLTAAPALTESGTRRPDSQRKSTRLLETFLLWKASL